MTDNDSTQVPEGGAGQGPPGESSPEGSPRAAKESAAEFPGGPSPSPSDQTASAAGSAEAEEVDPVAEEVDPVAKAERERDEYLELAQRARAELENFRKRTSAELTAAEHRGRVAIAREVLPALDNLERALLAAGIEWTPIDVPAEDARSEEVSAADAFAQGVALVYRELQAALARVGIDEFDPTGERFDPNRHEAIATRAEDGAESGVIVETLQRGYTLAEQAIRPARVIVAE